MTFFRENKLLCTAFILSLVAHAVVLTVRFVSPDALNAAFKDPGMEIILVNAKHDRAPLKADALAQVNLDGGGTADSGRAKSPLPDRQKIEDGDSVQALQRRIRELEQRQRTLAQMTQAAAGSFHTASAQRLSDQKTPVPMGSDAENRERELARRAAEIARRIEEENKRPKKTFISPSTRAVGHATYFFAVRERIEKIGTINFPQKNGKKLYGELTMSISIFQNGEIYLKDPQGGVLVDVSSGNPDLDEAARRIVLQAAPFDRFPPEMRSSGKDDVWVVTTRFKFTREHGMEASIQGS